MSTADPNQLKPEGHDEYGFTMFISSLIVDGVVQLGMTFWTKWILNSLFGFQFHFLLFWLAMTMIFVTLHWYNRRVAAEGIMWQLVACILLSIATFVLR